MSGQFKVGEVVIGQNYIFWPERNGAECVILAPLALLTGVCPRSGVRHTALKHIVQWSDGEVTQAAPSRLRRRPPSDSHERTYMQRWRDMAGKAPQRQVEVA